MVLYCVLVTFPYGILGQVWYLIESIPDLCSLSYFKKVMKYTKPVVVVFVLFL